MQRRIKHTCSASVTEVVADCCLQFDTDTRAALGRDQPLNFDYPAAQMGNSASVAKPDGVASLHDLKGVKNIDGQPVDFEALKGKVS